ncbi:MAG TPA: hypothetical protein DDW20_03505 [Firmicutes bacterium]|nr:hypothetical protein [Bacillota bacterium]
MKGKYIFLLFPLLIGGCNNSSISDDSSSSSTLPSKNEEFTPLEGEVRKWFDHGLIGEDRFYNYCPSTFVENGVKHIFYCSNKMFGNITDYIAYRKGEYINKEMIYSPEDDIKFLLEPTKGTWDARHTCDPSVIKGEFKYDNVKYQYLMAYLGCVTSDNTRNETGLAVANSPEGPWIKCDKINPILKVADDNKLWGNGQSEIISVDKKGRVIICNSFSSPNLGGEQCWEYDLSDLNNPILIRGKDHMNTNGTANVDKEDGEKVNASITNIGLAYDEENKKIILAKGRSPFAKDGQYPNFIADQIDVFYLDDSGNENPFDELFKSQSEARDWKFIGTINEKLTGFKRNHNTGLVRDPYGRLVEKDRIEVAFTRSDLSDSDWGYLSTYRIYSTAFKLPYLSK